MRLRMSFPRVDLPQPDLPHQSQGFPLAQRQVDAVDRLNKAVTPEQAATQGIMFLQSTDFEQFHRSLEMTGGPMAGRTFGQLGGLVGANLGCPKTAVAEATAARQIEQGRHCAGDRIPRPLFHAQLRQGVEQAYRVGMARPVERSWSPPSSTTAPAYITTT